MSELMRIIAGAMRADAEAVRLIGQNIANAGVTAYQRQIPLSAGTFANALEDSSAAIAAQPAAATDFQPGALRSTGEPLHVALDGAGFFVLSSDAGSSLTRRGDFQVSRDGTLVSATGKPVLGENGSIQLDGAMPAIDADGTVRVRDQVIDRLRIVTIAELGALQPQGDGSFGFAPGVELQDSAASVRQGYLEGSNVTPVGEMVQLMETVRHFEAAQRFARGYDDMMQKAISELGKVG